MFGTEEWEILSRRRRRSQTPQHHNQAPDPAASPTAQLERTSDPGPLVINTSRGPILDQASLLAALQNNTLSGAALDVTDPEPLPPDSELWDMENVVVTPHVSGLTTRYLERALGGVLVENLGRRARGVGLVNLVDRERGY